MVLRVRKRGNEQETWGPVLGRIHLNDNTQDPCSTAGRSRIAPVSLTACTAGNVRGSARLSVALPHALQGPALPPPLGVLPVKFDNIALHWLESGRLFQPSTFSRPLSSQCKAYTAYAPSGEEK